MWRSQSEGDVTCIACSTEVARSSAREYDRHGDRWGKRDRDFEFLCKPCYRECCHQPRKGLEEDLIEAEAGTAEQREFLAQYYEVVTGEPPGRERG